MGEYLINDKYDSVIRGLRKIQGNYNECISKLIKVKGIAKAEELRKKLVERSQEIDSKIREIEKIKIKIKNMEEEK